MSIDVNLSARELAVIIGVAVAFGAFLLWGNRPTPEQFATTNHLELDDESRTTVAIALRRTYRGRVFGGAGSFVVAVLIAASGASTLSFASGLAAIFAGSLVGIALAQRGCTPADPMPIASLEARDPHDYRPRRAAIAIGLALAVLIGYGLAMVLSYDVNRTRAVVTAMVVGIAAVATVAIGARLQRRIVEQAQDHRNPQHARVDDALRAGAVRAVHHAVMGILLCGITLLAVTGATRTETMRVERDGHVVMTLPSDGHDFRIATEAGTYSVTWIGADGVEQATSLAAARSPEVYDITSPTSSGISNGPMVALGFWLAFAAGIGALFEWRAAARSWRRPSPRTLSTPRSSTLATSGAAGVTS